MENLLILARTWPSSCSIVLTESLTLRVSGQFKHPHNDIIVVGLSKLEREMAHCELVSVVPNPGEAVVSPLVSTTEARHAQFTFDVNQKM